MSHSKTAIVFNVVHGSFVDGWGIRTTVFLKGCPLRCVWCCNPESQRARPELRVIPEHCSGCGRCLDKCAAGALTLLNGVIQADRTICGGCGACVKSCWPGALAIWGAERTAEDVFSECLRDRSFYAQSGGGVTLSGGEATLWPDFCLEMLRLCHAEHIPVAIDTCGQVESAPGLEVLRQADLVLFDVKGLEPNAHRENTGMGNETILRNLKRLEEWEQDVIIRYPVIPDHNQSEAEEIARFLSDLRCVKRVDLIPYHPYGIGKYTQLGRTYTLNESAISSEEQQELLALFRRFGLKTQLGG